MPPAPAQPSERIDITGVQQATLHEPITLNPGDEIQLDGSTLQVWNSGHIVATYPVTVGPSLPYGPNDVTRTVQTLYFVKERIVPGTNVSLVRMVKDPGSDDITAFFSNGNGQGTSLAAMQALADQFDGIDFTAETILLALTYRRSPDGSDLQNMVGGSISVNLQAETPFVVTFPT